MERLRHRLRLVPVLVLVLVLLAMVLIKIACMFCPQTGLRTERIENIKTKLSDTCLEYLEVSLVSTVRNPRVIENCELST